MVAEIFNNDMIQSSIISKVVFISALVIVCFSLISVIFPALIINVSSPYENNFETFELGAYSIPFLIINSSIIGFIIFCIKKPQHRLHNIFNIVLNFEISKKVTIIVGIIILFIYIGLSIPELSLNEADQWGDYAILNSALEIWPFGQSDSPYVTEQNDRYVRMFLLDVSHDILQNIKILPFVASSPRHLHSPRRLHAPRRPRAPRWRQCPRRLRRRVRHRLSPGRPPRVRTRCPRSRRQ